MSHRNMLWTHQSVNPEWEQGHVQVQTGSSYYAGTVSDSSNLGVQVAVGVPGNTANVGICDLRNHERPHVHNSYPHASATSRFVFPTNMYNPSMSAAAVNIYIPQTQSFGLGNVLPPSLHNQVSTGTIDESSSSVNFGDSAIGFMKRKNAVVAGNHHFLHGFAGSSSSVHAPQNPVRGPWNASSQSNCLPSSAASNLPEYHNSNGWPFLEESSADASNSFSSVAACPELVPHGNYLYPASHISQCNTWVPQAASHGVPQWGYSNAMVNPPGTADMPNGNIQDYHAGHSSIHGPLPHFCQNPLHSMQAPQIQVPHQQFIGNNVVHGLNPSATGLPLDPRMLALPFNAEHTFGHPMHPPLINQANNGALRILPYQNATVMNHSRIYESGHVIDEHRDMRLDVDNMTYEELVALQEQIGDVNTGLTESYIQENLRSTFHVPGAASISDQFSELSLENDACIICQEEYEAKELIGTLECGHKYHVNCIKQWLMMKNLCPICKTTALLSDRRNG
ncbi:probable E3 ubiquitin-protein ligase ZFP1 isoform X2 [Miscanthus floridulus]|uniref:probable E3 ubiquitin-protein ligase ZFP1 isoform X2 n=1 Tax=Miscanthus floridulus TaxID=154761 RepID=UPI00345AE2F7